MDMADQSWASSPIVRRVMQGNKRRDTKPELEVRRLVHGRGLRYLVDARPEPSLRRTADLVFRGPRVAVFVDGCFWHGCPEHHTAAKTNSDYWSEKVLRNRARDEDTTDSLREQGWIVLRFWAHEDPASVADTISVAVRGS